MTAEYNEAACPVPGLPEALPEGERLLWQGSPDWREMARRVFHVRKVALYFALLVAWRLGAAIYDGQALTAAVLSGIWLVTLATVAIGLLAGIAWLIGRSTIYTITSERVAMQFGVAIPMALNLPFKKIESAALRSYDKGCGDIPLTLSAQDRVAYVHIWPHARPRHLSQPQPMLRCIPDAAVAARILADALAASTSQAQPTGQTSADRPCDRTRGARSSGSRPQTAALA